MTETLIVDDLANIGLTVPAPADDGRGELGQGEFLTLMIAQFRNQDPFEPVDNGEFLGQLAQFGTVEGIERLNSAFSALSESMYSDQALQAANLVGHTVLAISDRGFLPDDGNMKGAVALTTGAENVQIDILDSSGQLIRRMDLGQQPAGLLEFEWNGMTDDNERASEGNYSIEARVIRGLEVESAEIAVNAEISSVNLGRFGQSMTLNLVGGDVLSMTQVLRIL